MKKFFKFLEFRNNSIFVAIAIHAIFFVFFNALVAEECDICFFLYFGLILIFLITAPFLSFLVSCAFSMPGLRIKNGKKSAFFTVILMPVSFVLFLLLQFLKNIFI